MKRYAIGAMLLVAVMILGGCRQSLQPSPTPDPNIQITLIPASPFPLNVKMTLTFVLTDGSGAPISGAKVDVRADMNMAGMLPVLGSTIRGTEGRYSVDVIWTMSGEWFIDTTVTLVDGRVMTKRFEKIQVKP